MRSRDIVIRPLLKKIIISIIVILVGILAYTGLLNHLLVEKTFLNKIDSEANSYFDKTMKNALYTFAVVRGINAIISVVQASDVAVSPAGVGITIAVGEILDPLNDLIERFSWVILASTTSLGIQKILMTIGIWLGFKVLLSLSLLAILVDIWLSNLFKWNFAGFGYRLMVIAILVRFCIPLVALATSQIDSLFLEDQYERAAQSLEEASMEIDEDETGLPDVESDPNLIQRIKNFFNSIEMAANIEERIQNLKNTISGYIDYIIDLIVVFILKTIIVPLVVLWVLIRFFGQLIGVDLMDRLKPIMEKKLQGRKSS